MSTYWVELPAGSELPSPVQVMTPPAQAMAPEAPLQPEFPPEALQISSAELSV